MRTTALATILFTFCLLVACTRSEPSYKLVQADSLMQKSPDSALRFLREIYPEELRTAEDKAYYALLVTQAEDKNYIFQTDDSLICIAVQHYDSIRNVHMQAKAYYYWGCIWKNKEKYPQALSRFFTAISHTQKTSDHKLAGYIYNNIANLYFLQELYEQADSIYQITERIAIQEKDSILWTDVLSQRGMIAIDKGKAYYHEAEQKILQAFEISRYIAQKNMIAKTAYSLSLLYGRMKMGKKAVEFAKLNLRNQENPNVMDRAYLVLGDAYYKISQYDSASIYLNKSLCSEDEYTKAGAYMRLADIAKKQGQLEKALEMERKYSSYLNSVQQKQQGAAIITVEKNIIIQRKQLEYKTSLSQFYSYMIVGIIIALALLFVLWRRHKKAKDILLHKNEHINLLQEEITRHIHNQSEKQSLKEELRNLRTERQALLKESYEHSEVYVKMKRIIQAYKKTDKSNEYFDEEDWRQLIAETDMRWNDITIRLATQYPLSQDEIYLCCLYLTDIPTSHFRYIMECSRDAIYKKTRRILEQKMKCSDKSASLRDVLEKFP